MKLKRIMAGILAASTAVSLAACSSDTKAPTSSKNESTSSAAASDASSTDEASSETPSGEKLTLKVLTHRTDRKDDGTLDKLTDEFEKKYNCTVEYQAFKDYAGDVSTMMNTKDYGDVLMIPDTVKVPDLGNYFEPLGSYDELDQKYLWANQKMYDGTVYGLAHVGTVSGGICYNKRIWEEAGVTTLPKTPEEFIAALKKIKEKFPDTIPYYTNYKDGSWTLAQWSSLVMSASGKSSYENDILTNKQDLFVEGGAYYEVFKMMYDIFSDSSLIESDPISSDWEGSKVMIGNGEVATMVMGSWAVAQFKELSETPEDIGYMPAPFTAADGKQYAQTAADYCMGVNKNSDDAVKELGKKYIEWFIGESGFAQLEGGVCTLRGSQLPNYLEAFAECEFFVADAAPDGLVGVWNDIDNTSEVGIWTGDAANFKLQLAEAAFAGKGDEGYKAIVDEVNKKWATTRDANEALAAYLAG